MRIDHDIGIYSEHYAMVLKWYSLAFKDKHPSKEDEDEWTTGFIRDFCTDHGIWSRGITVFILYDPIFT